MKPKVKTEYEGLLKTGMFYEFYPEMSGDYEKDKKFWKKEHKRLQRIRNKKGVNDENKEACTSSHQE